MGLKSRPNRNDIRKLMREIEVEYPVADRRTRGWVIMRVRDAKTPIEIVRRTSWLTNTTTRSRIAPWTSLRSEAFTFPNVPEANTAVDLLRRRRHKYSGAVDSSYIVIGA